jgi:hypothetical protein
MLEPQDRRLLLDALRPPAGYTLETAIGTTFSLDLVALLTVPLAFTLFDWEDEEGRPMADPLALLEAVRRHADHVAIFCQAGKTYIPRHDQRLYAYLESSVVDVKAPRANRSVHPKLWALSFHAPDAPTRVRVLCASRNLTFDRSWDTLLVLDGEVQPRRTAFERNLPLTAFLSALPDLAVQPAGDRIRVLVNRIQAEVGRTKFAPPPPFEDLRFLPLGLQQTGDDWPFEPPPQRLLVVSPFVGPGCLLRLVDSNRNDVLVARGEELAKIGPEILGRFGSVHVLLDGATAEALDEPAELRINGAAPSGTETTPAPGGSADPPLVGLHAKLYVADDGPNARVWTGSANAGNAAFDGNVEFLVELRGKKSQCGIESILNPESGAGFGTMLQDYPADSPPEAVDPVAERIEDLLTEAQSALASTGLRACVNPDGSAFFISLSVPTTTLPPGVAVRCWPITLQESAAIGIGTDTTVAEFGRHSFEALTTFFAFHLQASEAETERSRRFVLNLPMDGAPSDRRERLLRSFLHNRAQVLRLLLLMLADEGADALGTLLATRGLVPEYTGQPATAGPMTALLEPLMRTLARRPAKLLEIAQVVDELARSDDGRQLLPDGFEAIWEPISKARKEVEGW